MRNGCLIGQWLTTYWFSSPNVSVRCASFLKLVHDWNPWPSRPRNFFTSAKRNCSPEQHWYRFYIAGNHELACAAYTKGADAMGCSKSHYERKRISFGIDALSKVVKQIEALAKSGAEIDPKNLYPSVKQHRGKSRDLPMVDNELRQALIKYLYYRLSNGGETKTLLPSFCNSKRRSLFSQHITRTHGINVTWLGQCRSERGGFGGCT